MSDEEHYATVRRDSVIRVLNAVAAECDTGMEILDLLSVAVCIGCRLQGARDNDKRAMLKQIGMFFDAPAIKTLTSALRAEGPAHQH